MSPTDPAFRGLLRAAAFAARAHRHQLRKDGATPYVSHPFRVCLTARHLFGVEDPAVLAAALLHDTVEDANTDYDDVAEAFGAEVAGWVAALSKDKRLPEPEREAKYKATLAAAPAAVKLCKLADIHDNLLDSDHFPPSRRVRTFQRARDYLAALGQPPTDDAVRRALDVVRRLLEELDPRSA
jgi:guanosine-3',5'-bis(diphosphate) 3'-pyrophosphohydrolase